MLKTRNKEKNLLETCIKLNQSFVVDNTNPTIEDRKRYIPVSKQSGFKIIGYFFDTKIKDSLSRNSLRKQRENIPIKGVYSTLRKLIPPSFEEGFDILYHVTLKENAFIVKEIKNN